MQLISIQKTWIMLAAFSMLIAILLLESAPRSAYAFEPTYYIGQHIEGYQGSNGNTWDAVSHIYGSTNFGTTFPSSLQEHILSITSSAGWNTGTNTATGAFYQFAIQLDKYGAIYNDGQVWQSSGTALSECFTNGCPFLTSYSSLNYIRQTMYWPNSNQVVFQAEAYLNGGGYTYNSITYNRDPNKDTSNAFSVGYVKKIDWPKYYYAKLLQTGVEAHTQEINWQVKQYDISYRVISTGTTRSLVNDNTFSNWGAQSDISGFDMGKGSDLTWDSSGHSVSIGTVGTLNANALYYNIPGSGRQPGEILWYANSSPLNFGEALWGKPSLHVLSVNVGDLSPMDGFYAAVKDSSGIVIGTGYTPFNVILPTTGTYRIDYTDFGTSYYFTNVFGGSKPIISDYNVVGWGSAVMTNAPNKESYTVVGRYYDQGNPAGYSLISFDSKYPDNNGGATINGLYAALERPNTNSVLTKGFTPLSVGIPASITYDVIWGNCSPCSPYNYYYQYSTPGNTLTMIFDHKANWGGTQEIVTSAAGGRYTDTGRYTNSP